MPLQDHMKLISTDDHVIEHPRVWLDRLPAKDQEAAPRVVEIDPRAEGDDGSPPGPAQVWLYEGRRYPQMALNAVAGRRREDFGLEPTRYDQILPGCYDPTARVKDMDADGIHAQLCFPSFPKFDGTVFLQGEDKDLALRCVQAWNDFMVDEWCAAAPDRFIPVAILPLWDPLLAAAEVERTAAKGARTISFPENPAPLGLPSFHTDHWDPVFAAAQAADMPLSMHFGTSGKAPMTAEDAPFAVAIALFGCNSMYTTVDLLFSPVFHKFPGLKVALSEGGIGWMPYILERVDYTWERHKYYTGINQDVRPSDLFRRHIWGCFIDDEFGIANRHAIGVDRITWECDYPHSDSNWPVARKRAAETLADVPDAEVHQIVELNARKLFHFDA
ncbi:MAG TPA: amidohydrolase family protein [Acidimicrobiia bacterium]|nr:amidohydrolase family protein [Acidimicrobiia bacterium]